MAITYEENQYQIPRGRVFFSRIDPATDAYTGERPFGNCPGITINISAEKADHYSSEAGLAQKDKSIAVRVDRAGTLNCDNWSTSNVALFLSGNEDTVAQTADPVADETITVNQGLFYQLGQTTANPAGHRNVSTVVVKADAAGVAGATIAADGNYEVDAALGRIRIVPGGAIDDGDLIHVAYAKAAATWARVKTGSTSEITGALRVIADNASGANRDYYMPLVTLTAEGDLPIIAEGTDFVAMGFGLEVLKPANGEAIYVDGRPA